jgi:hypothetical protein
LLSAAVAAILWELAEYAVWRPVVSPADPPSAEVRPPA